MNITGDTVRMVTHLKAEPTLLEDRSCSGNQSLRRGEIVVHKAVAECHSGTKVRAGSEPAIPHQPWRRAA